MDTAETTARQNQIDTMRAIADWLEAHPAAEVGSVYSESGGTWRILHPIHSRAEMIRAAREIGGKWTKGKPPEHTVSGQDYFELHQQILPGVDYQIYGNRELVCERVVVGTETREVEGPDPDAVAALPVVKRTEEVERVEWRCPPSILAEGVSA